MPALCSSSSSSRLRLPGPLLRCAPGPAVRLRSRNNMLLQQSISERTHRPNATTRVYTTSASRQAASYDKSGTPLFSPTSSTAAAPSASGSPPSLFTLTNHRPRPSTLISGPRGTFIMATATQTRGHMGHHHHHHDNTYLTSSNKNDAGVRITRIGLFSNLGMAVAKGAGGYMFNSQAMVADAWHSLTDLASDILTLATVSWSIKPPTDKFPLGFGKVESLGSLGVSGMLLFGGMFMFKSSLVALYAFAMHDPETAAQIIAHDHAHGHGHSHSHGPLVPSIHAAWLAAGTVIVKEWLYHATMKVARERKSSVLASNAVHHRVDSLTGIVTLAVVVGANLLENFAFLDPLGGLLISLMVIRAGWGNTWSALQELADGSIDDTVKKSVRNQATKALEEEFGAGHEVEVREITGTKSGQNYLVDVDLVVPNTWSVEDVWNVENTVRTRVGGKVRGVRKVRVRFLPNDQVQAVKSFDEFIPGDVSPKTSPEPESEDEHDHHDHGHGHKH